MMGQSGSTLPSSSKVSSVRENPFLKKAKVELFAGRSETGDTKFVVQYQVIHAHRCVLAALSPKYKAQFYGAMPNKEIIELKNVSAAAFMEFLQFFYVDEVTLTMENIECVIDLAQQSLVADFVEECTKFLLDMVGIDKLVWCYRLSVLYQIALLQQFCEEQISMHITKVFKSAGFLECDCKILELILKLDQLTCKEVEVFDACISWARAACKRNCIELQSVAAHLREVLGDAVFQIRFCTMSVEEFASLHKLYAGFFSTDESNEIIYGIGKVNDSSKPGLFNHKPRIPITTTSSPIESNPRSLDCSISGNGVAVNRATSEVEKIAIICDKPILLKGLVVRLEKLADISVDIDLGAIQLKKYSATVKLSDNQNRIFFREPVEIKAHERCIITLKSAIFKRTKISGCCIKSEIVDKNGIWFQFPNPQYGSTPPILITNLLYIPAAN